MQKDAITVDITERHSRHADEHILPFLRRRLSEADLLELAGALRSDELQLTTHPHPHLPDAGPLAKVSRKVAGLIDRGRDSSTDLKRPGP